MLPSSKGDAREKTGRLCSLTAPLDHLFKKRMYRIACFIYMHFACSHVILIIQVGGSEIRLALIELPINLLYLFGWESVFL